MARIDNLENFLSDVAEAIKNKKGKTEKIKASDFDNEIASIEAGGVIPSGSININQNGVYDVTNYANANVNIPSSSSYAPRFLRFSNSTYTDLNQELTGIDCSNLVSLASAFQSCTKLISVDISHFNTSNVTSIESIFSGCSVLTDVNANFDISNVTIIRYAFKNCKAIVNLDLSGWGTCKAQYFSDMFYGCTKLESLDLRNFNTTNTSGQKTDYMFQGCSSLKHLDMRSFEFKSTQYNSMFNSVPTDCEIVVKDETQKTWITSKFSNLTNVKTLVEYQAEGGV